MPKKSTKSFLVGHPLCAFCGGFSSAETIEHCPPRAMFERRWWPEGYEFPSCAKCNSDSSDDDLLVAFLARMNPVDDVGDRDGKVIGLIKMINRQMPDFFNSMWPTNSEARRINRRAGVVPSRGETHQDAGALLVPLRLDSAVKRFSAKLSKALYYKATGLVFPEGGEIAGIWFTNFDFLVHGYFPIFRELRDIYGIVPDHVRSSESLNEQFSVKWSMDDDRKWFVMQAMFGKSFGLVTFGSIETGLVGKTVRDLNVSGEESRLFLIED